MIYREDFETASDYIDAVIAARKRRIRLRILIVILSVAAVLLFLYEYYKVRHVTVEGSTRYTDEEITDYVCTGFLGDNSLALSIRYRNKEMPQIPFVETMTVEIVNHNTIRIIVYEKAIAGYVDYLGQYMYFSRDGTVVESSSERLEDVPEVVGLTFDHVLLYQKLPVEDESIFQRILNVTQLLDKYDIHADKIYFDDSGNMTVFFGNIRAVLGDDEYTDEKLSTVSKILPSLEGKSGTLELSQFTPNTDYVTFVAGEEVSDGSDEEESGTEKLPVITVNGSDGTTSDSSGNTASSSSTEESQSDASSPVGSTGGSLVEEIPENDTSETVAGVKVQEAGSTESSSTESTESTESTTENTDTAGSSESTESFIEDIPQEETSGSESQ